MTGLAVLPVILLVLFLILAFRWRHPLAEGRTIIRLFALLIGFLAVLAIAAQFVRPSADNFPYVGEEAAGETVDIYSKVIIDKNPEAVPADQVFYEETTGFTGNTLMIRAPETVVGTSYVQAVIRNGRAGEISLAIFRPAMIMNGYDLSETLPRPKVEISDDGKTISLGSPFHELTINQISRPDLPPFSTDDGYSSYHRLPIYLITVPEGTKVKTEGLIDLSEI